MATVALTVQLAGIMLLLDDASEPACAARLSPGAAQRILLVSADGREPGYARWRRRLEVDGVPFDAFIATRRPPLTPDALVDARGRPRYHAVILASDALLSFRGGRASVALAPAERAVLASFERRHGIREIVAAGDPATPGLAVAAEYTELRGDGRLTAAGRAALPGVPGPVPLDGLLARPGRPRAGALPLLVDRRGRTLLAMIRERDGRERIVSLIESPELGRGFLALAPRMLDWATHGVHLGAHRAYLAVHVDDVLIANYRWDPVANRTTNRRAVRMTGADARATAEWVRSRGVRLDMVFNGAGAEERRPLGCERPSDDLTLTLLEDREALGWINHTFTHPDLDDRPLGRIGREIAQNRRWAQDTGIAIAGDELVTGEHSGLRNPNMAPALRQTGIRWIASDASRGREQRALGPALTVPRWAPNVYYDAATRREQVDQYNFRYAEKCPPEECRPRVDWRGYLRIEAERLLQFLLDNDPRPLYAHQSNLAADRTLLALLDELLARRRALDARPLVQLSLSAAGEELRRRAAWGAAWRRGAVTAHQDGDVLTLESTVDVHVPVTGVSGTDRTGWVRIRPGERRTLPLAAP